jgi:hypothetical protein
MTLAVSDGAAAAYAVAVYGALLVGPAVVTLLKGNYPAFLLGLLTLGAVWMVAAFRLARPVSWWARRFYGEQKMRRARLRYR